MWGTATLPGPSPQSLSLAPPPHSPDVNYEELARCTDDFNGAQCKAVCVEAVSGGCRGWVLHTTSLLRLVEAAEGGAEKLEASGSWTRAWGYIGYLHRLRQTFPQEQMHCLAQGLSAKFLCTRWRWAGPRGRLPAHGKRRTFTGAGSHRDCWSNSCKLYSLFSHQASKEYFKLNRD